jgi:hypothetical protein
MIVIKPFDTAKQFVQANCRAMANPATAEFKRRS